MHSSEHDKFLDFAQNTPIEFDLKFIKLASPKQLKERITNPRQPFN
jgi:hypothetical protein